MIEGLLKRAIVHEDGWLVRVLQPDDPNMPNTIGVLVINTRIKRRGKCPRIVTYFNKKEIAACASVDGLINLVRGRIDDAKMDVLDFATKKAQVA